MKIDLFVLHDDLLDGTPRKCIVATGKNLKKEINKYIQNLINKGWTKRKLTFYFMKKLNFSECVCNRLIYLRKEFYHLIFLRELLKLDESYDERFKLQEKIDYIKACQPPLRLYPAIKEINQELCKIAGAHAADGTMRSNYFSLSEGYKSNIIALKKWLFLVFNMDVSVKIVSENEWKISFNSKIFSRYLKKKSLVFLREIRCH